jgi:hypothetical protein
MTREEFDALPDYVKAECAAFVDAQRTTASRPRRQACRGSGVSIRTLCFRSRETLLEADEASLVRDVCLDLHKAEVKLKAIQERLQSVREWAADQVEQLTAADTKLSAAIVAALLSTRGKSDGS